MFVVGRRYVHIHQRQLIYDVIESRQEVLGRQEVLFSWHNEGGAGPTQAWMPNSENTFRFYFEVPQEQQQEQEQPAVQAPVEIRYVVYTAVVRSRNGAISSMTHMNERSFLEAVRGYENQGCTILKKKKLKI